MPGPETGGSNDGNTGPGDGDGNPTGTPVGDGVFDPDEMYFTGWGPYSRFSVSLVQNPDEYLWGMIENFPGALWGSSFVYIYGNDLKRFVPDEVGLTTLVEENDEVVATPDCGDEVLLSFDTTPSGRLFYTCGEDYETFYEDGEIAYPAEDRVRFIVNDDLAVVSGKYFLDVDVDYGLKQLGGDAWPLTDLPSFEYWFGVRAVPDGFHVVAGNFGLPRELWEVKAGGSAEKLGDYPASCERDWFDNALGANDVSYVSCGYNGAPAVLGLSLGAAEPEVLYTEGPGSRFSLGVLSTRFITGP